MPFRLDVCEHICIFRLRLAGVGVASAQMSQTWITKSNVILKDQWAGFDLTKIGSENPVFYRGGDIVVVSGCITCISPMKNTSGFDMEVARLDTHHTPLTDVSHLAPSMMSRYEGIHQCGTSLKVQPDGKLTIFFVKAMNPMVLHLSGLCFFSPRRHTEPNLLPLARYEMKEWNSQGAKTKKDAPSRERTQALQSNPDRPPAFRRLGKIVFLEGELQMASYGPLAQRVATMPEGLRPLREVRLLANLLRPDTDLEQHVLGHSVALTLRPDGSLSVQGGRVHAPDNKGTMRILGQNKSGRLSLDAVHFLREDGPPVELGVAIRNAASQSHAMGTKAKLNYLLTGSPATTDSVHTAVCFKQDNIVFLEGHLSWSTQRPNAKQPLALLPVGYRPHRREVFFTRGGSDMQERCRVDVDKFGRIFCPEGVDEGRLDLSGIVFGAAGPESNNLRPRDPDWDDLKLQYQRSNVNVISSSFGGHALLEQFIQRTNVHEWSFIEYDLARNASRKMLLPLGQVQLRGNRWDKMNLGRVDERFWRETKDSLDAKFKITTFHTLMHLTNEMFERVAAAIKMREEDRKRLVARRRELRILWGFQRKAGLTFTYLESLASDIVDQMFDHWDFKAQLQGALLNDFRTPASIEHLYPQRGCSGKTESIIRKHIIKNDMPKFEEIRQFFYLYETTGNNMTHCSLMGVQDTFTTTGKWHFPDAAHVQKQLFEHIAWLFTRQIYLYISERQTSRFPFIEDLDIQAKTDWREWKVDEYGIQEKMWPPDELIMRKPKRDENGKVYGEPGELMERRAYAIHMIYPQIEKLYCHVYSASGFNKGKAMLKSSFHLVWPQLIVDADRAPVIRYVTLGILAKETAKPHAAMNSLQAKLLDLHESNVWELVFDSTTIHARNGLRLPFSDKTSMVITDEAQKQQVKDGIISKTKARKTRLVENRPSKAVGTIEFTFQKDPETDQPTLAAAEWTADAESHPINDWIQKGSCRLDANSFPDLTPWYMSQEVIQMLPKKSSEDFFFEQGEADGEGGHWMTHRPYPNIRRCKERLDTQAFMLQFEEMVNEEQLALDTESRSDLVKRLIGTWTNVTNQQAIWRTLAATQTDNATVIYDKKGQQIQLKRGAEVIFLQAAQKLIVSGPKDVTESILRAVQEFTKPDDNAIMPIYDIKCMERY